MEMLTNVDRLHMLYRHPGPFVSFYAPIAAGDGEQISDIGSVARFTARRAEAERLGATTEALDAIEARLALPLFGDVGGRAVLAAADGTTAVDTAHEGPAADRLFIDSLPYAAPLLEWQQWKVPHLAIIADPDVFEVVTFLPGEEPRLRPVGSDPADAAMAVAAECREQVVELVLVGGEAGRAKTLMSDLVGTVPTHTEVLPIPDDVPDLAEAVVRAVADKVARRTVALLREFRFLLTHDGAVQGADATLLTLARGDADLLLIHDDPDDERRAWFGPTGSDISTNETATCSDSGRLVDVAIRSAVLQGSQVRIIPSTGDRGPDENIGALIRDPAREAIDATGSSTFAGQH